MDWHNTPPPPGTTGSPDDHSLAAGTTADGGAENSYAGTADEQLFDPWAPQPPLSDSLREPAHRASPYPDIDARTTSASPTPPPPEDPAGSPSGPGSWGRFLAVLGAVVVVVVSAFAVGRLTAPSTDVSDAPVSVAAETPATTTPATTSPATTAAPPTTATAPSEAPAVEPPAAFAPDAFSEPVADIAELVSPAVVQLESGAGLGSGVIYDQDGLILTAAHVVEGSSSVTVRLADGTSVDGEVLGTHDATDVAVISIPSSTDLPIADLAIGVDVRVGQLAVALGSPFGLDQTVTSGIVSAIDRVVSGVSMVQTDAAINPGNSGGPLVDSQGRVIGINDQIFTQSGGNEGVGFAISIDLAAIVADQIVAGEAVQLAFLGVSTTPSSGDQPGALVQEVIEGSAAAASGLEVGDVIVEVDGRQVLDGSDLRVRIITTPAGSDVTILVLRQGEPIDLSATLGTTAG